MAKVTITSLESLANPISATGTINSNLTRLANAFDNTLSRDGTTPNQMLSQLDMNSHRVLNLPDATTNQEPVTLSQLNAIGLAQGGFLRPILGTAGEVTVTNGNGISGNPTISLPSALTFTSKTITGGTFNGSTITAPTGIVKADVGLGNVDNTSDATKNSASATLTNKTISGASNTLTVRLNADVTGNLPVTNLATGTGASSTTFWRGDGTWATPVGSGTSFTGPGSSTNNGFVRWSGTSGTVFANSAATVNLASEVSGNLAVANLNSGTSASASTFWRGDGTWATPTISTSFNNATIISWKNSTGTDYGVASGITLYSDNHLYVSNQNGQILLRTGSGVTSRVSISDTYTAISNTLSVSTTNGTLYADNSGIVSAQKSTVKDYGATGNGSTPDEAAIASAIAARNDVYFPAGTYYISTSQNWPVGKTYTFAPGAVISVNTGQTLTIRGTVVADHYLQIFSGAGVVTGIKIVKPEWFGAVRNGVTDDAAAIRRAIASVEGGSGSDGNEFSITFSPGTYLLLSTVTFTPTALIPWRVRGAGTMQVGANQSGTVFLTGASFSGSIGVFINGSTGTTLPITNFDIGNFKIIKYNQAAATPTVGMQIGSTGVFIQGFYQSQVHDVQINGFSINLCIQQARLINFHRIYTFAKDNQIPAQENAGSTQLYITLVDNGSVTSDFDFNSCEFSGPEGSSSPSGNCINIGTSVPASSGTQVVVSGIRFNETVCYGSLTQVVIGAANGGRVCDIWFNPGCQFEAPVRGSTLTAAFNILASGALSQIFDIHIAGTYMSGNGFFKPVTVIGASSGTVFSTFIHDNFIANAVNEAIDLRATGGGNNYGITIHSNQIVNQSFTGGNMIYIEGCSHSTTTGNVATGSGAAAAAGMIRYNGGGDWHVASGNNSSGQATVPVSNTSSGTHVLFAGLNQ